MVRHDGLPAGPTAAPLTLGGGRPASAATPRPRPAIVPLGSITIDGRTVALAWLTHSDSILIDFTEFEPKRIGTIVMRANGPGFVAQPGHLDWLRYEDREARLVRAAVLMRAERQPPDAEPERY